MSPSPSAAARPLARWPSWRRRGKPFRRSSSRAAPSPPRPGARPGAPTWRSYSDYANRLPRGRTYVRNGSVIDLQITPGTVAAQVSGSSIYRTTISGEAGAEGEVAADLRRLRWRHRLAGGTAARAFLQGRHGPPVPPGRRTVPRAHGHRLRLLVPRRRLHVQACRRGPLRRWRPPRQQSGAAVHPAPGRSRRTARAGPAVAWSPPLRLASARWPATISAPSSGWRWKVPLLRARRPRCSRGRWPCRSVRRVQPPGQRGRATRPPACWPPCARQGRWTTPPPALPPA